MKKSAKNISKHEKGQILVIFALMIVGLIGSAALVTDIGTVYFQKTDMQNCADAAALAGAQDLPDDSTAVNKAVEFAGRNGLQAIQNGVEKDGDTITATTPYGGDSTKIEVVCERTVQSSFARVLGITQSDVSARAVAQKVGSVGGGAFNYAIFSGSPTYTLAMSGNSNITGNVHTNYKANMTGNITVGSPTINGSVEAVSDFSMGGNTHVYGTVQAASITTSGNSSIGTRIESPAAVVPMYPDFSETIRSQAEAAGPIYIGNKSLSGTITTPIYIKGNLTINGNTIITSTAPIYVDGTISITGNFSYNGSTIFATGAININGNNTYPDSKMLIYSKNSGITIGGNSAPAGIIFAPNGQVRIDGNTIHGRVIGNTVSLNGNYDVTSSAGDLDVLPPADITITLVE